MDSHNATGIRHTHPNSWPHTPSERARVHVRVHKRSGGGRGTLLRNDSGEREGEREREDGWEERERVRWRGRERERKRDRKKNIGIERMMDEGWRNRGRERRGMKEKRRSVRDERWREG